MAAIVGRYKQTPGDKEEPDLFYCIVLPSVECAKIGQEFILEVQKPFSEEGILSWLTAEERGAAFDENQLVEFKEKVGDIKIYEGLVEFARMLVTGDDYDWPGSAEAHIADISTVLLFL